MNGQTKILVKVGKKSDIKFSHAKAFRAVTIEEISSIINNNDDIHVLVIENILSGEEEALKNVINNFISSDSENKVFFYVKDNDDITCGVADELGLDIYLTLDNLHRAMYLLSNINVSTNIDFRKSIANDHKQSDDFQLGFDSDFGLVDDSVQQSNTETITSNISDEDIKEDVVTNKDISEQPSKKEDTKVNLGKQTEVKVQLQKEDTKESLSETKERNKKETQNTSDNNAYIPDEKHDKLVDEVEKLKRIIKSIRDEKDIAISAYKKLLASGDFLEEPISIDKYNKIKENNEEATREIIELNQVNDELKDTIDKLNDSIDDKDNAIEKLREDLTKERQKYNTLKSKADSGELSAEELAEAKDKIRKLERRMGPLNDTINNLNTTVRDLSEQLDGKTQRIDFEVDSRLKIMEVLFNIVQKYKLSFNEINELKTSLTNLEKEHEKLKAQNNKKEEVIASQSKKILELSEIEATIESKINLAIRDEKGKVAEAKTENEQLNRQIALLNNQLQLKDQQYNELVKNGAGGLSKNSLQSINDTLRKSNSDLQNKLSEYQKRYSQLESESKQAVTGYKALEEQNKNLQSIINSSAGENGKLILPNINYLGKAKVYTVFGSGSYGVTTTAISLTSRLPGRTLFIDLDLTSPKADVWFRKAPIVQGIPDVNTSDIRSTAMSLFFDRGIGYFEKYLDKMVIGIAKTKNNATSCLFGAYSRPVTSKIIKSDIQGLLNLVGKYFDSIVIDAGKIGSSDVTDQLIKILVNISEKAILVTTPDKFDIRNAQQKFIDTDIKMSNILWIVNLCTNTAIDNKTLDKMKPAKPYMIPFEQKLYMSTSSFLIGGITKGKFNLVLSELNIVSK